MHFPNLTFPGVEASACRGRVSGPLNPGSQSLVVVGGLIRRPVDAEVHQLAQTTGQPVADLAQRSACASWQNRIAINCVRQQKPLAARSALCFLTKRRELQAREVLQQLIKQAQIPFPATGVCVRFPTRTPLSKYQFNRYDYRD
jgi:hypothetical protein